MDGNRIEFIDVAPRSDGDAEDALRPDHPASNRIRRATAALTGMAVLGTLVVWANTHTHDHEASASPTVTVSPTSTPRAQPVPVAPVPSPGIGFFASALPAYARLVSTTRTGDLLVQGTPALVRRTLTAAFSVTSSAQVSTVFGDIGANQPTDDVAAQPFISRLITARSEAYRVQILIVASTSNAHAADFRLAPTPRGSILSFAEVRHSGYVIDIVVSGPGSTPLARLENSPRLLDGLIGGSQPDR